MFHCGNHTCPETSRPEKPTERVKEMIKKLPRLRPAEIQSAFGMSSLRTEEDWEKVEKRSSTAARLKMDFKSKTKCAPRNPSKW